MINNEKNNFWRRFTWMKFMTAFLFIFFFTLLFELVFDFNNWQQYFLTKKLIGRTLLAGSIAIILTLWSKPEEKKRKT